MNKVAIFKPSIAEATKVAEQFKGLKIKGLDDKDGYKAVYDGQQELKKLRVEITKFGKKEREEALAYQKEVIRQEKELLGVIIPVEDELKAERDRIDQEKERQERMILLPSRKKMLEEIGISVDDDTLLGMDEKEFSETYNERKLMFLEEQEKKRKEAEEEKRRAEELEKAKSEAAEKATKEAEEKAEKEKQEAIDKIRREQEEKDRKVAAENARLAREELEKAEAEKAEQKKTEKNKKYQEWLKKNGWTQETNTDFIIQRSDNTFTIFKKIDQITIK